MIKNLVNKKCYVGFHASKKEYCEENYFGSSKTLNNAIKKYGINNFVMGIIEYIDPNEWQEKEKFWIKNMNSHVSLGGYNLTWGGDGSSGHIWTEESKCKNRNSHKGKYTNKTWEERYGKKIAEQMKQKQSELRSGKKHPLFGKKHDKETIKKMKQSHIGILASDEAKQKMSNNCKGKTWEERYGINVAVKMREKRKNNKKKCKYCNKNISPNCFLKHENSCKNKKIYIKNN